MVSGFWKELTLARTAGRIRGGMRPTAAIKEHVDAWNRYHSRNLFLDEPELLEDAHLNAWLAGCAEYEAFLIGLPAPRWTECPQRFLDRPFVPGGPNTRRYALIETPFAWRRRLVFGGRTGLTGPAQSAVDHPDLSGPGPGC